MIGHWQQSKLSDWFGLVSKQFDWNEVRSGIRGALAAIFFMKDSTPGLGHCLGNVEFQSIMFAMTETFGFFKS